MIHDVVISPLKILTDDRGKIMHMLRWDSPLFRQFGEIYFSTVFPGAVKAWKRHRRMGVNLAVPMGRIRLVMYDDRKESVSHGVLQSILLGQDNYMLVSVPPMIWFGVLGLGSNESLLVNCATLPHEEAELERRSPQTPDIPYVWDTSER